jgi:hypothetical protein
MNITHRIVGLAMALVAGFAWAEPDSHDTELARIKTQKEQLVALLEVRMRECFQRFNVNACKRQVQLEHDQAMDALTSRQRELAAQKRHQKADQHEAQVLRRRQERGSDQRDAP